MRRFALIGLLAIYASILGAGAHQAAPAALAAFPGGNGRIAFSSGQILSASVPSQIMTVEADGSDPRALSDGVQPAWSPDGKRIAFSTNPLGAGDIAIVNADGSGLRVLTSGADTDIFPGWSPDGKKIAFLRGGYGGLHGEIWVVNDDGTGAHQVTNMVPLDTAQAGRVSWSPDGTKILFTGWDDAGGGPYAGGDLFVVSASGGAATNLTNTPAVWSGQDLIFNSEISGDWSPDGSKIVFRNGVSYDERYISVMNADGSGRHDLLDPGQYGGRPSWSPDGNEITYSSGANGDEIKIIDASGGGERALGPKGYDPDWQPAPATKVEFTQGIQVLQSVSDLQESLFAPRQPFAASAAAAGANGRLLVGTTAVPYQLASVEPDGSDFRILGDGTYGSWSPDGRKIAFEWRDPAGADCWAAFTQISIMDADGSNLTPISTGASVDMAPSWSPDGEWIAFWRDPCGPVMNKYELVKVRADGTGMVQLTDWDVIRRESGAPKWSPDGSRILFHGIESSPVDFQAGPAATGTRSELYTVPAVGGALTRLTNDAGMPNYFPDWSPDGSKIAFGSDEGIWVMNAAGGGATKIAADAWAAPVWSPDGKKIAYTANAAQGTSYVMDPNGGNRTAVQLPAWNAILDWQPVSATRVEFTQGIQVLQSTSGLQESLFAPRQPFAPSVAAAHGNGKLLVRTPMFPWQLASVDLDGSDFRTLGDGFYGSWSPDGRKIVFDTQMMGLGISMMDADGSNATPVLTGPTGDRMPTWSPDGTHIAFLSNRAGGTGESIFAVYTARADGTDIFQLTDPDQTAIEPNSAPKWSPDGSRILFLGQEPGPGAWDLYTVPAAGGAPSHLTNTAVGEAHPEWSPDGSKIAFGDGQGIWVMSAAGGGATNIATAGAAIQAAQPVWSPDGAQIAYSERTSLPGVLPVTFTSYVMDANGGNKQAIPLPASSVILDWQPVPATKVEFTQGIQQLQSISELVSDLQGDGKPPVPIIAGKPAVMRVLFDEVQQVTTYDVEVSGQFNGSEPGVTLKPGCTLVQRRKQEAGCKSVDFYFTPPQGNWSVTLRVREAGTLVEEHEFKLTSEARKGIVLKAVSVCDAKTPGQFGVWLCEDAAKLIPLVSLLRKVAPTDSVSVQYTAQQVPHEASAYPAPEDWWNAVVEDIHAMYGIGDAITGALSGDEIYYFGMARPDVPGTANGIANDLPSRGAFARSVAEASGQIVTPATVAHEVGHMLGRDHSGVDEPTAECWPSDADLPREWPYADNALRSGPVPGVVEVGFDVASKKALPGDENFDLMGYCYERWISPFTYVNMMSPPGGLGPRLAGVATPVQGTYWLIRGAIAAGGVEFRPLFAYETEGSTGTGSGPYRIEVQDGGGAPLFTRAFVPVTSSPDLQPGGDIGESAPFFGELVPVQAGAARIVVFDDQDTEMGAITLAGAAPTVNITQASNEGDTVTLQWAVTDADSTEHTYRVDYSPDGGETWANLATGLPDEALVLDAANLPGSGNAVVRVIASDGGNSGEAVSTTFTVAGKLPHGEIISPEGGPSRERSLVWLQAAAWDTDDGTLDGVSVRWSSSQDGNLGTGASLPVYDLSVGTHTITMTAIDSDDNEVTDTVTVTVFDGPIVEGQVGLSGDVDCSGAVNSIDGLKLLRHVAGLSVDQPGDCPGIGTGDGDIFGDVNCDGSITAADALFVLRFVAALPANVPQGCRPVGT